MVNLILLRKSCCTVILSILVYWCQYSTFSLGILLLAQQRKKVSTDKCDLTRSLHYCSLQTSVFIRPFYLRCTFISGNFNMGHYLLMVLIADLQLKATIWTHQRVNKAIIPGKVRPFLHVCGCASVFSDRLRQTKLMEGSERQPVV